MVAILVMVDIETFRYPDDLYPDKGRNPCYGGY